MVELDMDQGFGTADDIIVQLHRRDGAVGIRYELVTPVAKSKPMLDFVLELYIRHWEFKIL